MQKEIKTLDGAMNLDDSNDVIGISSHKDARNGVFKGNAPEMHFTSIKGNQKQTNTNLFTSDCRIEGTANVVYRCTPLSATAKASYCNIEATMSTYGCDVTGIAEENFCNFTGQAYQMFYYYDLVRCDGSPGVKVGRSKRQSAPIGQVYAGGDFATYACRYINSEPRGPYYDYNLPGMPEQAPEFDFDLTNSSYVVLDPGGCTNCTYCDPTVNGWGMGYHVSSKSMACYNRISPPFNGETGAQLAARKPTIYTQCTQETLGNGVAVYASAPLNNPTGLLPAGYYSWGSPSDPASAKVWYVSAADTIVSLLKDQENCADVGYPTLAGTVEVGCALECVISPTYKETYHGSGYVNVSEIRYGTATGYKWTITNPAGTTSAKLNVGQVVENTTNKLANGVYVVKVYDSRGDVFTSYNVTVDCKCCGSITGQALQMYYYYELSRCDGSTGTLIGRSKRQSIPLGQVYAGGTFATYACRYVSLSKGGPYFDYSSTPPPEGVPVYDVDLDVSFVMLAVGDCNNCTYCNPSINGWGTGYSASSAQLACYNRVTGTQVGKYTFYTQCEAKTLQNGVRVYSTPGNNNPSGFPPVGYYAWGNNSVPAKVWYVSTDGILQLQQNCSDVGWPDLTATVTSGCNTCRNQGFVKVTAISGGNASGYYWTITNPAGTTSSNLTVNQEVDGVTYNLGNGTYTIKVYDSRTTVSVTYTKVIDCQCCDFTGQAFQVYYYYNLSRCDGSPTTFIGRTIRQSALNLVYYLGGQATKTNCATVISTSTNTEYTVDLDANATMLGGSQCNNTTYCNSTPNGWGGGRGTSSTLACYYRNYPGPDGKVTYYTQAGVTPLANGVRLYTTVDAFNNLSGLPPVGWFSYGSTSDPNGAKVWYIGSDGILQQQTTCGEVGYPALSGTYTTGCAGYAGTGTVTVTAASGGTGRGYYWTLNGGTAISIGTAATGLGNSSYTIRIYDSRGVENVSYTATVYCEPEPAAPTATATTGCTGGADTGTITVTAATGGTGSGYYWKIDGDATVYSIGATVSNLTNGERIVRVYDGRGTLNTAYTLNVFCQTLTYSRFRTTRCSNGTLATLTVSNAGNTISIGSTYKISGASAPHECYTIMTQLSTTTDATGLVTLALVDGNCPTDVCIVQ